MSGPVGTARAGSNKHTGPKDKMTKNERNVSQQQQPLKNDVQSNKMQPTQDQIRLAQMMSSSTNQVDANPDTVKELMALTGKGEDIVVIALHDADNDADRAVMTLLEGGDEQGEWREQGGKRKKKAASQKEVSINEENFEVRNKDRGDREERERDNVNDRQDLPPRRGRRNGGPPPRLARGRGRDRGNFGGDRDNKDRNFGDRENKDRNFGDRENKDRNFGERDNKDRNFGDRDNKDRNFVDRDNKDRNFGDRDSRDRNFEDRDNKDRISGDDWDNDRGDDKRERRGADRGRTRGRGGFGSRGGGRGGGRFTNSGDRDNRSYNSRDNRVPRFEKMNNSQPIDGPEIDTWTNETAETNTSKDTDWDNWNDSWANEEDQWTGTLDDTKVFTPSQMKLPEPDPVINEPPSSLGQRLDVGSLFSESAKFSKAPDYSQPGGDAYINQFKQAATESIKNTIGIGSSSRTPQSLSSMPMPQQSASNSLGLSSLAQSTSQMQDGMTSVLSSLTQGQQVASMSQTMSQLSQQFSQSQMGMGQNQQSQVSVMSQSADMSAVVNQQQGSRDQVPPQSRLPSVQQQQQNMSQSNLSNSMQRQKPQRSKMPPPSKIPSTAVEMPGHIPRNPQFDLQFGIDFGTESNTSSFGFGSASTESTTASSTYSNSQNGPSSVISNHLNPAHVSNSSSDTNSMVSNIMASPSAGTSNVPSSMEPQQTNRPSTVFHNSVYNTSPKAETQSIERDQNKINSQESMPYPSAQHERKTSPMMSRQTNQNLNSGSLPPSKNDTSSNNIGSSYSVSNGYGSSYQSHQKASSISQTQAYTQPTSSQPPQGSSFPGQYSASQSAYPSSGQTQFPAPPSASQYPPTGQPPQFNNTQSQYSSNQNQYVSGGSSSQHPSMPHGNHQSQYSSNAQNSYASAGQSQYSGYQNNTSFPSHPQSQSNFASSQTGGPSSSLYPVTTQSSGSSYTSQSSTYQSPSAGSYHSRDNQTSAVVSTQSSSVSAFPSSAQSSLKPATCQASSNYSSQTFNTSPTPLQPSTLANKLGESLTKMSLKDASSTLDNHQSTQYDHTSTSTTVSTALSLPSSTSTASLSTGTTTISSTSTATSITSTSRIASMPSTSKAPPNLPPGVPLMGQYIMGQSTMPPFYSVQPPLYGYDDVQLLQQRMPLQAGSYYDMSAFPAQAGSTLPTGRDQQPPMPNVPFSGTSADTSKMSRVDAQSPNSASPQNPHSAAQQPSLINFHYGYYYPSMFPGAAGLQYPMFPMPPVTNAAAHAGTTATTQFQKNFPSHVYTTKGYDDLNQAQDFSKTGYGSSPSTGKTSGTRTGTSDMGQNAYNKSHTQGFDKQGFHGGTPPPFNLPLATATQAGPMGAPTTPYGAPFLPVMAAHQAHSQMMHHPMQQDSSSSNSRGLNQNASQGKSGATKSYGAPAYWNN